MTYNIVLICDDNYFLPTAVCVNSIKGSAILSDDSSLCIHICSFQLSDENVKAFESMTSQNFDIRVHVFDESLFKGRLDLINQRSHVTPTALIKFELPFIFDNIDVLLYLDSDIIVKGDILPLFALDISNYYIAAAYEFWCYLNQKMYTFRNEYDLDFYFNSGVMLLNLNKMRKDGITEKLWDYKLNKAKTRLMDQESLNAICGQKTLPISVRWNFNPLFLTEKYVQPINKIYRENFKDTTDIEDCATIIHYVGKTDKPWVYEWARMREYWDTSYAKLRQEPLTFKTQITNNNGKFKEIKSTIQMYGFTGLMRYVIYRVSNFL